jgi:hypothetical protein
LPWAAPFAVRFTRVCQEKGIFPWVWLLAHGKIPGSRQQWDFRWYVDAEHVPLFYRDCVLLNWMGMLKRYE